jgi:hypothetical protein
MAKAMHTFGDGRSLAAYDIGCQFAETLARSSLGPEFHQLSWRICVNSFHGYAHNYGCQLKNHPNVIDGIGLEDLETLEQVFSASNALASVTRYASAFRRRVFIDMFFKQWDEDKYHNLGTMLLNNYKQAFDIITIEGVALAEAKKSLGLQDGDIECWREEEKTYFKNLGVEPEWDVFAVAYVENLQKLRQLE